MDRQLVWTEKASGDVEAIVRYIARRNPSAAAQIGFGIYERAQILLQHPRPERFWTNYATAAGISSFFGDGRSFIRFAATTWSLVECGQPRWAKQIWRRHFEERRGT